MRRLLPALCLLASLPLPACLVGDRDPPALKRVFRKQFRIGASVSPGPTGMPIATVPAGSSGPVPSPFTSGSASRRKSRSPRSSVSGSAIAVKSISANTAPLPDRGHQVADDAVTRMPERPAPRKKTKGARHRTPFAQISLSHQGGKSIRPRHARPWRRYGRGLRTRVP